MNVIVWIKITETNTTEAKKSILSPENLPSKQSHLKQKFTNGIITISFFW